MKLNPLQIAQAMQAYGELKKVIDAMRSDSIGQDQRWSLFQEWLGKNPRYKKLFEGSRKLKPPDALDYIITELGFDPQTLATMLDKDGALRAKLESGIAVIQQLYKERMKDA